MLTAEVPKTRFKHTDTLNINNALFIFIDLCGTDFER